MLQVCFKEGWAAHGCFNPHNFEIPFAAPQIFTLYINIIVVQVLSITVILMCPSFRFLHGLPLAVYHFEALLSTVQKKVTRNKGKI